MNEIIGAIFFVVSDFVVVVVAAAAVAAARHVAGPMDRLSSSMLRVSHQLFNVTSLLLQFFPTALNQSTPFL